jgi:hypothetical protein
MIKDGFKIGSVLDRRSVCVSKTVGGGMGGWSVGCGTDAGLVGRSQMGHARVCGLRGNGRSAELQGHT